MTQHAHARWATPAPDSGPLLHRKCGCGGTCGQCAGNDSGRVPSIVHDVLRSPGRPLENATRAEMEPRFGRSFSDVRIHSGARETESARSVGALAYAAGRHVVLGESSVPRHVLAHELAHVAQDGGGDALPQRVSDPSSAQEREASHAEHAAVAPAAQRAAGATLHRYRSKGTPNFGKFDPAGFTEEEFTDPKKQPWIENINIEFTGHKPDSVTKETLPTGKYTATYHKTALPTLTGDVTGGSPSQGLTDISSKFVVERIEGVGFHQTKASPIPASEQLPGHPNYKKAPIGAVTPSNMSFAVFFFGGEALHVGPLDRGSHACVHADWDPMRQVNYHSRPVQTKVQVSYTPAALDTPCCERAAALGAKKKGDVPAPCGKTDPKTCGGTPAAPSTSPGTSPGGTTP
jgi:Domain of unknown function (DUF4157)